MSRSERKKQIRALAARTGKRNRGAANVFDREAAARARVSGEREKHKRLCDICNEQITDPHNAVLTADTFVRLVAALYDHALGRERADGEALDIEVVRKMRNGPDRAYLDAVSRAYIVQFRSFYWDTLCPPSEIAAPANSAKFDKYLSVVHDDEARLALVLQTVPDFDPWLLAHDACLSEDRVGTYCIALDRIDRPNQAVEWTMHLGEKTWWNAQGWTRVLSKLFGRHPPP